MKVFYNPYYNEIVILSKRESKHWNDFDSALIYIGVV